jgi:hypothetical protein
MNHSGDVLAVRVLAHQDHDPLVAVVMHQGKELAMPENKDDGLALVAKL